MNPAVARLRVLWADVATTVHTAWIERRDRNPWPWILPIAAAVAIVRPH